MLLAEMPKRDAVSRSIVMNADAPLAPALLATLRTLASVAMRCAKVCAHCVTSWLSEPSSDKRNCVGPVSASIVKSWVGCKYSVAPATWAARSRNRFMVCCWLDVREAFRSINMRLVCSMVLLAPSTPTNALRLCTSGSASNAVATCCCSSAMRV